MSRTCIFSSIVTMPSWTRSQTTRSRICSSERSNDAYARLPCCHADGASAGAVSIVGKITYSGTSKNASQSRPESRGNSSSSRSSFDKLSLKRSWSTISFHARAKHCHSADRASTDQSTVSDLAAAAAAAAASPLCVPSSLTLKWWTHSGSFATRCFHCEMTPSLRRSARSDEHTEEQMLKKMYVSNWKTRKGTTQRSATITARITELNVRHE